MNVFRVVPKIIDYITLKWSSKESFLVEMVITSRPEEADIVGCKTCKYKKDYIKQVRDTWLLGSRCHQCCGGNHMIVHPKYQYWEELNE